jgi:hypothetical protein
MFFSKFATKKIFIELLLLKRICKYQKGLKSQALKPESEPITQIHPPKCHRPRLLQVFLNPQELHTNNTLQFSQYDSTPTSQLN